MLLKTWFSMVACWRSAFSQDRSFQRFLWLLVGLICHRGRGTLSSAIGFFSQIHLWSSDYRIFSRSKWNDRALFQGVIKNCEPHLKSEKTIVISIDDTGLPKSGTKIKHASWLRDPLGPKFQINLIRGLRCIHAMLHLPLQAESIGVTGISVGFELTPPPKKPKKDAPKEVQKAYREAQAKHGLTAKGAALMQALRDDLDRAELKQDVLYVTDGSYTNKTIFINRPERSHIIGRTRKDIHICKPADGEGRKIYGEKLPTPEEFLKDKNTPHYACSCFYGKQMREVRYKELQDILWPNGARRTRLRLIIIMPTPYRPVGCRKLQYNQPAYLITTDLKSPAQVLIQAYLDRWGIEVLHRDLKTYVGLGQAQVWSEKSITRLHPALVAAFSMLRLASIKAFGPLRTADYHELPRWRSKKDREKPRRPSAHDLLTRLRAEVASEIHLCPLHKSDSHAVA